MNNPMPYTAKPSSNALGVTYELRGPGLPQHANEIMPIQPLNEWATKCMGAPDDTLTEDQIQRVVVFLNIAFEQGKRERSREIGALLGAHGVGG